MMRARCYLLLLLWGPGIAAAWEFSRPVTVSELNQPRTFFHLESSGNRSLAISSSHIAVVWEDNRSGKPEIYMAFKAMNATQFTMPVRVSDHAPAYEPAVAGLGDGRFVVVWEASDHVWSRVMSTQHAGPVQQLSKQPARQITVTAPQAGKLALAWAEKTAAHYQILVSTASVQDDQIQLAGAKPVEATPAKADQLYPSLVVHKHGMTVGWEDRRFGHTRLYTAVATDKWFAQAQQLNYLKPWPERDFGKGTGAMRVVLASDGGTQTLGCWLDKRDFSGGYDVYAALSRDGGKKFGDNEKVQDLLGENQAQWHAVCAMDKHGHVVAAWDDQRDGTADIWFSWRKSEGWSDDESPPGANGDGSQSHPALVFDDTGRLHLVYVDRAESQAAIRYLVATPGDADF